MKRKALRAAADSEIIGDTYQEWRQLVGETMKKLENQGFEPVKIGLDVNESNDWCQGNKRIPDGESRSAYVAQLLRGKDNSGCDANE